MKKILFFAAAILAFILFSENVKAEQQVTLDTMDNYEEDLEQISAIENDIVNQINMARRMNGKSDLPMGFKPDYTKAYKIYIDTDIFSLESNNSGSIMQLLNEGRYVWSLFVEYNNDYYKLDISRGRPLREEIAASLEQKYIDEIKAAEGKWTVACVSVLEYDMSYKAKIADALKNTQYDLQELEFVLCGGLKFIHYPVAVVMYQGNAEMIIPLYELTIQGTSEEKAKAMPEGAAENDAVYRYDSIKNAINRMKLKENKDEITTGDGGVINLSYIQDEKENVEIKEKGIFPVYIYWIIGAVAGLAAGCAAFAVRQMRARKRSKETK